MAFGKKKDEQAPGDGAPEAAVPEASLEGAFAGGAEAPAEAEPSPPEVETAPPADAPDALAGGADSLLSAFSDSQIETTDNSVIIEMAGEHDIDDLLEELQTVASALGIVLDDDDADEDAA